MKKLPDWFEKILTRPPGAPTIEHMNDINWRDVSKDRSFSLQENLNREILVETTVTVRLAIARNINPANDQLKAFQEKAVRYAFIG